MMKDPTWISIWRSLAITMIDCGYLRLAILEREAAKRRWKGRMIAEVANALNVEAFEHHGETYWRLSGEGAQRRLPLITRDGESTAPLIHGVVLKDIKNVVSPNAVITEVHRTSWGIGSKTSRRSTSFRFIQTRSRRGIATKCSRTVSCASKAR